MRDEVFLLGRILLALVFLLNGIGHLTKTEPSAQYATYKKVPNPREAVLLSGALMILGAIAWSSASGWTLRRSAWRSSW